MGLFSTTTMVVVDQQEGLHCFLLETKLSLVNLMPVEEKEQVLLGTVLLVPPISIIQVSGGEGTATLGTSYFYHTSGFRANVSVYDFT